MTTATLTFLDQALAYLAGGISLVPCSSKDKKPENRLLPRDPDGKPVWKPFQSAPPTEADVRRWIDGGCKSLAAVCGKVSGGLLILDFDEARFFDPWRAAVGEPADGLPVQRTGRGFQVALRCPEPGENDKLAWVPDEAEQTGRRIAIETRGEAGYAVLPGSLHPSGRTYETITGDFAAVPTVSQARADALLAAARKLDEAPLTRQEQERIKSHAKEGSKYRTDSNGQGSVIETYNQTVTIEDALAAHGYTRRGDRWVRPGGESPSVEVKEGRSLHFSTDDPLNDRYWHRAFDIFCYWEHGGDCKAAVKAAAELLGMPAFAKPAPAKPVTLTPDEAAQYGLAPGPSIADQAKPKERIEYPTLTCADLMNTEFDLSYHIDGVLAVGQPCVLSGPKKSLKTSLLI